MAEGRPVTTLTDQWQLIEMPRSWFPADWSFSTLLILPPKGWKG